MSQPHFRELIAGLTTGIARQPLDADLDRWLNVDPPGSSHRPAVTQGRALALYPVYLLPQGQIEFPRART